MWQGLRGHPATCGRGILLVGAVVVASLSVCQPARGEWSAIAEQRTSYTTDAFQFSSARRLALSEDPSQPTVVPLDKSEDVIWEPTVEVIRSDSNHVGLDELSVKAHGYIYTDKPIFNHGEFRIQDRQWLNPDTSVLLRYRYVPNLFLGPNVERRSGSQSLTDERVTSHTWRAELQRQLNEHVAATFVTRYGLRLYNQPFAERDTRFYAAGPRFDYRVTPWVKFSMGYLYERGLADGREEPQFMDDVSYYNSPPVLRDRATGGHQALPRLSVSPCAKDIHQRPCGGHASGARGFHPSGNGNVPLSTDCQRVRTPKLPAHATYLDECAEGFQ